MTMGNMRDLVAHKEEDSLTQEVNRVGPARVRVGEEVTLLAPH